MASGDIHTVHEDGVWKSKVEGGQRATSTGGTKADQQAASREMAIDRGVEHFIHNLDGRIGQRNTYPRSRVPRSSKG